MEMITTGRLPIHMANGIQNRLETPRAKTAHETRLVRGAKLTWNSWAKRGKPVVMPA